MNIREFIVAQKISMMVNPILKRTDGVEGFGHGARHWACCLSSSGAADLILEFSQGSAHTKPPTIAEVLDCLASDSSGIENSRDFEEWAGEYGYDTDSRKAERIYNLALLQSERLNKFLGSAAYHDLLWEVERE